MKETVLVTGSSRGIGRAVALKFASCGYHVVINCARSTERMEEVKKEVEVLGAECLAVQADVGDPDDCKRLFKEIESRFGHVDVLVNNAGISIIGLLQDLSFEDWNRIVSANLSSVFHCAKLAIPGMIHNHSGKIINISSVWLINGFITALSAGFSYLVSHAIGEGNKTKVESAVRQSITAAILLGVFLTLIVFSIHQKLPVWLGAAPEVLPGATAYMGIFSLGLIGETLGVVLSADLRSAGNTRIPLAANLTSNLFNVIGNFFLIYPSRQIHLPFGSISIWGAGLGVKGAAISTACSQYLLAAILLWVIYRIQTPVKLTLKGNYRFQRPLLHQLFRISFPVMMERSTLCMGQVALTAMISDLGTLPLAAHYLTNQTEGLLYLPAYGFSFSATALIGQSLGAGDKKLAKRFAKDICLISAAVILAACIPVYILSGSIIHLFTNDPQVIDLGRITLRIAAATEIFFSFTVMAGGICRGSGDVNFSLMVSLIGMWGFRIGMVWIATHVLSLGVTGVWAAIGIDCFIRACLFAARLISGKWIHE